MWMFYLRHIHCGATTMIMGYNECDAFRRNKHLDPNVWIVEMADYED